MNSVVPGTFDVGLLNLVIWFKRVVLPVFGKPINCILFIKLSSIYSYNFLIPNLLILLTIKILILPIFSNLILFSSLSTSFYTNLIILYLKCLNTKCSLRYFWFNISNLLITRQSSISFSINLLKTYSWKLPAISNTSTTYM